MGELNSVDLMRERITDEIFFALGLRRDGVLRRILGRLFYLPTQRFSEFFSAADEAVRLEGVPAGCRVMLSRLKVSVLANGIENLPPVGPLLVVSNHPGAYDSIALGSCIPHPNLKLIVYETQFYRALPNISKAFIYANDFVSDRMLVLRHAIKHLQAGGVILQFGTGTIDPDPAHASFASEWLGKWSPSLELLLRKVPETRLVLAISSDVILKKFTNHPLIRIRHGWLNQRRLAEFIQVIQQLLVPKSIRVSVKISFSKPIQIEELEQETEGRRIMPAVIARARRLLSEHNNFFYNSVS